MNPIYEFTIITFNENGEYVKALYVNGELFTYGDNYHDKISVKLDSFIDGFKYSCKFNNITEPFVFNVSCGDDEMNIDIAENGDTPPKQLKDIKKII